MSLTVLIAAFSMCVLLHNLEEALWLPRWSMQAGRFYRPIDAAAFRFGIVVQSALLLAVVAAGLSFGPHSFAAYLLFGYVFAMSANAVIPHAVLTAVMRRYMPGTATGLLLNMPLGYVLLRRSIEEHWVAASTLAWAAPAVAFALLLSIPALFAVGKRLYPAGPRASAQSAA